MVQHNAPWTACSWEVDQAYGVGEADLKSFEKQLNLPDICQSNVSRCYVNVLILGLKCCFVEGAELCRVFKILFGFFFVPAKSVIATKSLWD